VQQNSSSLDSGDGTALDSANWKSTGWTPWIIAAIEGFSTLAVEVIAIRLAIPVVGSSITLTGVMLGVVLFALSAGYWRGGVLSARWDTTKTRVVLSRNLLIAAVLYGAVAFPFEAMLLEKSLDLGLSLPLAIGFTATSLFLIPIYLASQTVPMLAELTNTEGKAGKASGKILFFSTVGSVAGGIVTPIWLFPWLGVGKSTLVVCAILAGAAAVMALGHVRTAKSAGAAVATLAAFTVSQMFASVPAGTFSFDSTYQSVRIMEEKGDDGRMQRILMMNEGRASGLYIDTGETAFAYVRAAEAALAEIHPERVLVIGAAGFTFPRDVANLKSVSQVDAVDVDPIVLRVAEKEFLKAPLSPKIRFYPLSARYAVRKLAKDGNHYGFTLVDAYFGKGAPDELLTVEFFRDVRKVSGQIAVNMIMDPTLESPFARSVLASMREAFGPLWVTNVKNSDANTTNMMVTTWASAGSIQWNGSGTLYHDDRNTADRDHVNLVWRPEEE